MIVQVMPGNIFGAEGCALFGDVVCGPGLAEARFKSQKADLNVLGFQLP
jgi:hypothetical protein